MRDKNGRLWVVLGLGGGKFGSPILLSRAWGGFTSTAVPGDLTGDGRPDVVAIHHSGYLYLVAGDQQGHPGHAGQAAQRRHGLRLRRSAVPRDLTGDSNADVVTRSSTTGQVAS